MKVNKKRICIILMLMMLFTSLEFVGVTAAGSKTAPPKVTNLKAHSGYNSITLSWNRVAKADGYIIYYKRPDKKYYYYRHVPQSSKSLITYKIKDLSQYRDYAFRVASYVKNPTVTKRKESASVMAHAEPVREMTYVLKISRGGTLDSHYGPSRSYRVNRGDTIIATKFTSGHYVFPHKDSLFHVAKTRVRSVDPVYTRAWNYGKFSAESFVNDRGISSRTGRLVWISTYTQHAYYFKGSKGKWKLVGDWECSTGKPTAPTPTGYTNRKSIWKKVRTRHGIGWWSPFSSMNSIHGGYDRSDIGHPKSSGCVGNLDKDAKTVYYDSDIGTTVLVF